MKWFRLYSSVLNDPKVQRLSPVLFKHWINILCVASENDPRGELPVMKDLAFALRLTVPRCERIVKSLCAAGVLETCTDRTLRVHGWDNRQRESDNIAARVGKHRQRKNAGSDAGAIRKVTLHETLLKRSVDTDTDTDTESETLQVSDNDSYKAADVAEAPAHAIITPPLAAATAAPNGSPNGSLNGHSNHWDRQSAERTAEEVARRVRLRPNERSSLVSYLMACPHLSHEMVIGETETFIAWLNKSHKGAEARVFYNRWLKPANQDIEQKQQQLQQQQLAARNGDAHNGYHHTTTAATATGQPETRPPSDFEQRYQANLAERAKNHSKMVS